MPDTPSPKQCAEALKKYLSSERDTPWYFAIATGDKPMIEVSAKPVKKREDLTVYGRATQLAGAVALRVEKGRCNEELLRKLGKHCRELKVKAEFLLAKDEEQPGAGDAPLSDEEKKQRDEVAALQENLDEQAAADAAAGPAVTLWEDNLTKRVRAIYKDPAIEMAPTMVKLRIPKDIEKALANTPSQLLLQKMVDQAQKVTEVAAREIAKIHRKTAKYDEIKEAYKKPPDNFDEKFKNDVIVQPMKQTIAELQDRLSRIPGKVLKEHSDDPIVVESWFKTRSVFKIAMPAVGFIAGAVATGVGSALAQPEVAVPAGYAAARSAASGYGAATSLWRDTEQTKEKLQKAIQILEKKYRKALAEVDAAVEEDDADDNEAKAPRAKSTFLSEAKWEALNSTLGNDFAKTTTVVKALIDDLDKKLGRARKAHADSTKEVHRILKFVNDGTLELDGKLAKDLQKNLEIASSSATKISAVDGDVDALREKVELLEKELSSGARNVGVILNIIVDVGLLATNAGVAGAGLASSFEKSAVFATRTAEWINTAVNSGVDLGAAASSGADAVSGVRSKKA